MSKREVKFAFEETPIQDAYVIFEDRVYIWVSCLFHDPVKLSPMMFFGTIWPWMYATADEVNAVENHLPYSEQDGILIADSDAVYQAILGLETHWSRGDVSSIKERLQSECRARD